MRNFVNILICIIFLSLISCSDRDEDTPFSVNDNTISLYLDLSNDDRIFSINNGKGNYTLSTSDESIVNAKIINDSIYLTPLKKGNTTVLINDEKHSIEIKVNVKFFFERYWTFTEHELIIDCPDICIKDSIEKQLNVDWIMEGIESIGLHEGLRLIDFKNISSEVVKQASYNLNQNDSKNYISIVYNNREYLFEYFIEKTHNKTYKALLTCDLTDHYKKTHTEKINKVMFFYSFIFVYEL